MGKANETKSRKITIFKMCRQNTSINVFAQRVKRGTEFFIMCYKHFLFILNAM